MLVGQGLSSPGGQVCWAWDLGQQSRAVSRLYLWGAALVKGPTQLIGPRTLVGTSQWWGNFLHWAEVWKGVLLFLCLAIWGAGEAQGNIIKGLNLSFWKKKGGACGFFSPFGWELSWPIESMVQVWAREREREREREKERKKKEEKSFLAWGMVVWAPGQVGSQICISKVSATLPGPFQCWELAQCSENKWSRCRGQVTPWGLIVAIELNSYGFWFCENRLKKSSRGFPTCLEKHRDSICQPSRMDMIWTLTTSLMSGYPLGMC